MTFKPFEIKMTEQQVIDGLRSNYGNEFTTPDIRAFCAMNDIASQLPERYKSIKYQKVSGILKLQLQQLRRLRNHSVLLQVIQLAKETLSQRRMRLLLSLEVLQM